MTFDFTVMMCLRDLLNFASFGHLNENLKISSPWCACLSNEIFRFLSVSMMSRERGRERGEICTKEKSSMRGCMRT